VFQGAHTEAVGRTLRAQKVLCYALTLIPFRWRPLVTTVSGLFRFPACALLRIVERANNLIHAGFWYGTSVYLRRRSRNSRARGYLYSIQSDRHR
jgi:hypothetical protein